MNGDKLIWQPGDPHCTKIPGCVPFSAIDFLPPNCVERQKVSEVKRCRQILSSSFTCTTFIRCVCKRLYQSVYFMYVDYLFYWLSETGREKLWYSMIWLIPVQQNANRTQFEYINLVKISEHLFRSPTLCRDPSGMNSAALLFLSQFYHVNQPVVLDSKSPQIMDVEKWSRLFLLQTE